MAEGQQTVHYVDVELRSGGVPTKVNTRQFQNIRAIGLNGLAGVLSPSAAPGGQLGVQHVTWELEADPSSRTLTVQGDGFAATAALPSPEPYDITNVRLSGAVTTLTLGTSECGLAGFATCEEEGVMLVLLRVGQPCVVLGQTDVLGTTSGSVRVRSEALVAPMSAGQDLTQWQLLCTPLATLTGVIRWLNAGLALTSSTVRWQLNAHSATATLIGGRVRSGRLARQLGMKDDTATFEGQELSISPGSQGNPPAVADALCALLSGTSNPTRALTLDVTYRYQTTQVRLPQGSVDNAAIASFLTQQLSQIAPDLRASYDQNAFEFAASRPFTLTVTDPAVSAVLGLRLATHAGKTKYRSTFHVPEPTPGASVSFGINQASSHLTLSMTPHADFPADYTGTELRPKAPFTCLPVQVGDLLFTESGWLRVTLVANDGTSCTVEGHGTAVGETFCRRVGDTATVLAVSDSDATETLGMARGLLELTGVHALGVQRNSVVTPTYSIILRAVQGLSNTISGQVDRSSGTGNIIPYMHGVAIAVITPGQAPFQPFMTQPIAITNDPAEVEVYVQSSEDPVGTPLDLQSNRVTLRLSIVCVQ